jgi:hypothetical protein
MISSLSILEVFILVALQRLKKQSREEANFEMVWKEYSRLQECSRDASVDSTYSRRAAFRAFERLLGVGLIAFAHSR